MDRESKFWLSLWSILGTLLLASIALGIYSGHLNDQRDLYLSSEGLQPYTITTCSAVTHHTEWHEAGWNKPNETRSITILTPKGN